jgi:hypothetical protein
VSAAFNRVTGPLVSFVEIMRLTDLQSDLTTEEQLLVAAALRVLTSRVKSDATKFFLQFMPDARNID